MDVQGETKYLDQLPDSDLVDRYRRSDDHALTVLLSRHSDALFHFCCSLVPTREDAEDICQEAMTRAIIRVDSLQSNSAFRSWLFSIAKNLSIDSFRTRQRVTPLADDELHAAPTEQTTPHDALEAREEHQRVAMALGRLRERHQRVLMLREVDGLSYADIAVELAVSESAVETLLFRARRRLREEYSKRDKSMAVGTALGSLRSLLPRLVTPLSSNAPLTAKLAFTAAVVAGTAGVSSTGLPRTPASAPNRAASSLRATAIFDRPSRPAGVGRTPTWLLAGLRTIGIRALDSGISTAPRGTGAKVEVRPVLELAAGSFPERSGTAARGTWEVSAVHRQHEITAVPLMATRAGSSALRVPAAGSDVVRSHLAASLQQRRALSRTPHVNTEHDSAAPGPVVRAAPGAGYRRVAHLSGSMLPQPAAARHSSQTVVNRTREKQHRDQTHPAASAASPAFRSTVSIQPTASKPANGSHGHAISGGRLPGVSLAVPAVTETPAHHQTRVATPVRTSDPSPTPTTATVQPQGSHGSSATGTNVGSGNVQGRRDAAPNPVATPGVASGTVVTTAVPTTPAAAAAVNPRGKPRP